MAAVSTKRLRSGTITGRACPYCGPDMVLQRLDGPGNPYKQPPTEAGALAAHVKLLHPDQYGLYAEWQASQ